MRWLPDGICSACVSLCLAMSGAGLAQGMVDPTRPPGFAEPAGTAASPVQSGEPVLQAVVLEANRKYAVISGQIVRLGESYAGARLVQISESEVTLRDGKDMKKLKLVPGIDKRPSRTATAAKGGAR